MVTRYIIVTGGVASSLGKGLTAASLGHLLASRGLKVTMQKLNPYFNVDPGAINPFQHGEVFVAEDGAETDLDLGHYEHFLDRNLSAGGNVATGKVYSSVIAKERRGEFLGQTVQIIPHVTNEIKSRIVAMGSADANGEKPDVVIIGIGGTVGDIESQPPLEAARQVRHDAGREDVFYLHTSLVPYLGPSKELKTKPTQHSVAELRSIGLVPGTAVLRCDRDVPDSLKNKIALMCDISREGVVSCPDTSSIYDIPKVLYGEYLDTFIVRRLNLSFRDMGWTVWGDLLERVHNPKGGVTVTLVGKYIDLPDAYLPVTGVVRAAGFAHRVKANIRWAASDGCETPDGLKKNMAGVDAIVIPGDFGSHRIEGKIATIRYARETGTPLLGICLGIQHVVIEATCTAGVEGASSTEFGENVAEPVIAMMEEQLQAVSGEADLGRSIRLGSYSAKLVEGSVVVDLYGTTEVTERHRHRYEVNNAYRDQLSEAGLVILDISPDGKLVEFVEYPTDVHPYLVATQAHPELKSRPTHARPPFDGLIAAALKHV